MKYLILMSLLTAGSVLNAETALEFLRDTDTNALAADATMEYSKTHPIKGLNSFGPYDYCLSLANKVEPKGEIVLSDAKVSGGYHIEPGELLPLELPIGLDPGIQNACAIVLHGGEY